MNVALRWSGCLGALLLFFGVCQAAGPAAPPEPNPQKIECAFYPVPEEFSMLSGVLAHSNGKVYLAGSYHVARLYEVDLATKDVRIVARMTSQAEEGGGPALKDPVLRGDLGDGEYPETKWKFAQDKIHTPLHEGSDGRVYGATHTKAEEPAWTRSYPGGHFFAYDPKTGEVLDWGKPVFKGRPDVNVGLSRGACTADGRASRAAQADGLPRRRTPNTEHRTPNAEVRTRAPKPETRNPREPGRRGGCGDARTVSGPWQVVAPRSCGRRLKSAVGGGRTLRSPGPICPAA